MNDVFIYNFTIKTLKLQ